MIPEGARQLSPGFYAYANKLHIDLDEFIRAAGGNPRSEVDRALAERIVHEKAADLAIPVDEVEL